MKPQELQFYIATSMLQSIGPVKAKSLISYMGSPEQIFKERRRILSKVPSIGESLVREISEKNVLVEAEKELEFIEKNNIKVLVYVEESYPYRMKTLEDCPILFYYKGDIDFNATKIISIVGTRDATDYGRQCCHQLIQDIRNYNPIIVSGLAYGIDTFAHREALQADLKTIAVLGSQLSKISPAGNIDLARNIMSHGCVMTEYETNTAFSSALYVRRNRIIAALSDATVVVESKVKGGALITANFANQYNRDVCAFPGNVMNRCSQGCNALIRDNAAALIENGTDLEKVLNWDIEQKTIRHAQQELFQTLSEEERQICTYLAENPNSVIDRISIACGKPMSKLSALLLQMEFKGLVVCLPGMMFRNV